MHVLYFGHIVMNMFTLVRTIAIAMTSRGKNRFIWIVCATLGVVMFLGEKVFAQDEPEACRFEGELYPTFDEACGETDGVNIPYECTYISGGLARTTGVYVGLSVGTTSEEATAANDDCQASRQARQQEGFTANSCRNNSDGRRAHLYDMVLPERCETGTWNGFMCVLEPEAGCLCGDGHPIEAGFPQGITMSCDRLPVTDMCGAGIFTIVGDACPPGCDSFESCTEMACGANDCPSGQNVTSVTFGDFGNSHMCGTGPSLCDAPEDIPEPDNTGGDSCDSFESCQAEACATTSCAAGEVVSGFLYGQGGQYSSFCGTGANICSTEVPDAIADGDNGSDSDASGTGADNGGSDDGDSATSAGDGSGSGGDDGTGTDGSGDSTGLDGSGIAAAIDGASQANTDGLGGVTDAINDNGQGVIDAINDAAEEGNENGEAIVESNDRINQTNQEGFEAIQEVLDGDGEGVSTGFFATLQQAPILAAAGNFAGSFRGSSNCPQLNVAVPFIDTNLSTDLHCTIANENASILQAVMLAIYGFLGIRIIMSA